MLPLCNPFPAAAKIHKPPGHKQCPQPAHTAANPSQVHTQRPHIRIQLRRNLAEPDKTHIGRKKLRKPIRTCHHIPISRQKHLHAPGIQNHHQHLAPKHLRPRAQHVVGRLRPSRRKRQRRCIRKDPQQHIPLRQNKQHLKIIPGHHQLQQQLQYGNRHHINPQNRHDPFRRRHILTERLHRDHSPHHPVIRRPRNLQDIIHNILCKQNHKETKTRPEYQLHRVLRSSPQLPKHRLKQLPHQNHQKQGHPHRHNGIPVQIPRHPEQFLKQIQITRQNLRKHPAGNIHHVHNKLRTHLTHRLKQQFQ